MRREALLLLGVALCLGAGLSWEQRVGLAEKEAVKSRQAAERMLRVLEQTEAAGRPMAVAALQSENAQLQAHVQRLKDRVEDLKAAQAEQVPPPPP